jgi:hypothetical protein
MAKKPRKTGKPKAVQAAEEEETAQRREPTVEEFIQQMHGSTTAKVGDDGIPYAENGLPTLDWLKSQFVTKSAVIRYLVSRNFETKVIAKHLGIRYQMVRNVKTNPLKRGPNESWLPKTEPSK